MLVISADETGELDEGPEEDPGEDPEGPVEDAEGARALSHFQYSHCYQTCLDLVFAYLEFASGAPDGAVDRGTELAPTSDDVPTPAEDELGEAEEAPVESSAVAELALPLYIFNIWSTVIDT